MAGVYGKGSRALTSPDAQGLFLESEWEMDAEGNITNPLPGTRWDYDLESEQYPMDP